MPGTSLPVGSTARETVGASAAAGLAAVRASKGCTSAGCLFSPSTLEATGHGVVPAPGITGNTCCLIAAFDTRSEVLGDAGDALGDSARWMASPSAIVGDGDGDGDAIGVATSSAVLCVMATTGKALATAICGAPSVAVADVTGVTG